MQWHYNEHCLGMGRQALILHGSHRELEPFKPAEDSCYHASSEVLALPLLSEKKKDWIVPSQKKKGQIFNFNQK